MPRSLRISPRFHRAVATTLLHAYAVLLLLLALHHHHQDPSGPVSVGAVPSATASHVHLAADCPLLYYSVTAFQATPDVQASSDVVPVFRLYVTDHSGFSSRHASGLLRSRAPPVHA